MFIFPGGPDFRDLRDMSHFHLEIKIHYHGFFQAAEHNILVYELCSSGVDSNFKMEIQSGGCKLNVHLYREAKPVLARTEKLGNALQHNWKFKLAASKKTNIVKCSSRFLDFDVQGLLIFCWAFATEAMPKPNKNVENILPKFH